MCLRKEEVVSRIGWKVFIKSEVFSSNGFFTIEKNRFNPLHEEILYQVEEENPRMTTEEIMDFHTAIDKDFRNGDIAPWQKYKNWARDTIKESRFHVFKDKKDAKEYLNQLEKLIDKEDMDLIRSDREEFIIKKVHCEVILTEGVQARPSDTWGDKYANHIDEYIDEGYPAFTCKKMKIPKEG